MSSFVGSVVCILGHMLRMAHIAPASHETSISWAYIDLSHRVGETVDLLYKGQRGLNG